MLSVKCLNVYFRSEVSSVCAHEDYLTSDTASATNGV